MRPDPTIDDVEFYRLSNANGAAIDLTNYGGIITAIHVPDREGKVANIALGYAHRNDYLFSKNRPYFGAVIGRYSNRIAGGRFGVDGIRYTLATNQGPNHLHGGVTGFDRVLWQGTRRQGNHWQAVQLSYLSLDGEEGYPGNLQVDVSYKLTDESELEIEYRARTDKATPVNLTQHTYFNLRGEGDGDVLDHELMIPANNYTPVDENMIPTGEIANVAGTPFDFRNPKSIGRDIDADHPQIELGSGYDHNWVLDLEPSTVPTLAAEVYDPSSGRTLHVMTQEPGMHFYTGNHLDGNLVGSSGEQYFKRSGFCLETQHFPDSPNQANFPSTILRPGSEYHTKTVFRFGVR